MQNKFVIKSIKFLKAQKSNSSSRVNNLQLIQKSSDNNIPPSDIVHQNQYSWNHCIFDDFKLKQNLEGKLKTDDLTKFRFKLYGKSKISKWEQQGKQLILQRHNSPNKNMKAFDTNRFIKTSQKQRLISKPHDSQRITQVSSNLQHSGSQKIPPSYHSMQLRSDNLQKMAIKLQSPLQHIKIYLSAKKSDNPRFKRANKRIFIDNLKGGSREVSIKKDFIAKKSDLIDELKPKVSQNGIRLKEKRKQEGWCISDDEDDTELIQQNNIFEYMKSRQLEDKQNELIKENQKRNNNQE